MTNAVMGIVNQSAQMRRATANQGQDPHAAAWHRLHAGLLIVDDALRIESMNASAEAIISRDDGLGVRDNHFELAEDPEHHKLQEALASARRGQVGAVAVWSAGGGDTKTQGAPYLLTVVELDSAVVSGVTGPFLITIADPFVVPAEPVLKCAHALGLTHGEAGLALALVRGETVTENAQRRGVSVHTVRSQLRNIRDKLGLSRQSQLISWLTRAALCTPPQPRLAHTGVPFIPTRPRAAVI